MPLDADTLLDRVQLKQQVTRWRTLTIIVICLAVIALMARFESISPMASDHIARVTIDGVISDNPKRYDMLEELRKNKHVKAVVVRLDSPGGTAVGGEELYLRLRRLAEVKPVVILMRTLCTSAGYMAALGGDYILAREGTITGSIGVIMQTAEFTELAEKWGVNPITVKSGPNKAAPNPLEKFQPSQRDILEGVVDDFYFYFVNLVEERRNLSTDEAAVIKDGRIFTGTQALEAKLIDAIGGELEAREWLAEVHDIPRELDIRDAKLKKDVEGLFDQLAQWVGQAFFSIKNLQLPLDGLVLIWQPANH